ncbi:hypothetical protein [Hymenobacter sp. BRD67]|uniref:hypothetical protein n=1 Tax=Hymenobacter sp. BRD67 TaxID=2675877 RepID=UPI001565A02A|nr:hypothetical protein [Hymenobacter sp. BRD67]QKG51559.1 hypothetical protein GKZ67_01825 [Hymenobacter sp. BRD67]
MAAQQLPVAADTTRAATDEGVAATQSFGFGKAEILGADGKTHTAYVPLSPVGFAGLLPFYRHPEEIGRFGSEPLNISVDKVQTIKVNELYLEHMVVKGKRLHVLATRVAEGPLELFNYTQTKQVPLAGATQLGGVSVGYLVYPKRHWYLRRQGELVEIARHDFVAQLTPFFQSDPTTVAVLTSPSFITATCWAW